MHQQTRLAGQQEANQWQGDTRVRQWLAEDRQAVATTLAVVDAASDDLLTQLPEAAVVMGIKGGGPKAAAAVLGALPVALWGDAKKASAYFGLVPKLAQSGQRAQRRMRQAGPGDVRRVLWLAARAAIDHDPAIRVWYDGLLARGKTKHQAQCAVMNTLLRHMMGRLKAWRTGQLDPACA